MYTYAISIQKHNTLYKKSVHSELSAMFTDAIVTSDSLVRRWLNWRQSLTVLDFQENTSSCLHFWQTAVFITNLQYKQYESVATTNF